MTPSTLKDPKAWTCVSFGSGTAFDKVTSESSTCPPGIWNIADFFTKPLPKIKFEQFVVYLVVNLERMKEPNQPPTQTVTMAKM